MQFLTDKEVLDGCARNVIKAQEALFKKHGPYMKRICIRYSRNGDDANDIFQEGFLKVFKDIHSFRNDCPLEMWMRKIFIHTAISFYRKNNLMQFSSLDINAGELRKEDDDDFRLNEDILIEAGENNGFAFSDYENAISRLSYEEIIFLVQILPPPQNIIFNMFYIENYTHKEIATELKLTDGNCRILLHRAKKNLKEKILMILSAETVRK